MSVGSIFSSFIDSGSDPSRMCFKVWLLSLTESALISQSVPSNLVNKHKMHTINGMVHDEDYSV